MKIGIKCRIYPNQEQTQVIHQTLGNSRFIYNYFLNLRNTYWIENKDLPKDKRVKSLSKYDEIKLLPKLKKQIFSIDLNLTHQLFEKNPQLNWMNISGIQFESLKRYWLKDSFSTALQQSLLDLDNAFQKFYKKQSGYPQFKKKLNRSSFTITPNNWILKLKEDILEPKLDELFTENGLSINNYNFYLNKTSQPLKMKLDRNFNSKKISKITMSKTPSGKFFITFLVDEELKDLKKDYYQLIQTRNKTASIDLGIRSTMTVFSKENNIKPKDNFNEKIIQKKLAGLAKHNKKLARAQRSLSRKQKGSNNRNKQRIKVARLHEDLVNYRDDFYHQASHDLIMKHDKIIIEDLNIKGMVKNKKLAKSISQQSWGKLITMLKYKCQWYGKELIVVDRFFPSSKLCSACGEHNKNYGVEENNNDNKYKKINIPEYWTCSFCKVKHQRDENACKNLMNYEVLKDTYKKVITKIVKKKKFTKNQGKLEKDSKVIDIIDKIEIIPLSERDLNACVR